MKAEALTKLCADLGRETVLRIVGTYLKNLDSYVGELAQALSERDSAKVLFKAHRLRSASMGLGLETMASLCRTVEKGAASEINDDFVAHSLITIEIERVRARTFLTSFSQNP